MFWHTGPRLVTKKATYRTTQQMHPASVCSIIIFLVVCSWGPFVIQLFNNFSYPAHRIFSSFLILSNCRFCFFEEKKKTMPCTYIDNTGLNDITVQNNYLFLFLTLLLNSYIAPPFSTINVQSVAIEMNGKLP